MKQDLAALNDYLFQTLETLSNPDLTSEELETELKRSKAVQGIANNIINNAHLALEAKKHADEYGYGDKVNIAGFIGEHQ